MVYFNKKKWDVDRMLTLRRIKSLYFLCTLYVEKHDIAQSKYISLEILDAFASGELNAIDGFSFQDRLKRIQEYCSVYFAFLDEVAKENISLEIIEAFSHYELTIWKNECEQSITNIHQFMNEIGDIKDIHANALQLQRIIEQFMNVGYHYMGEK